MPARLSSLAAELAEFGNATPYDDDGLDSDPEALDAGKRQNEDEEEEDEEDLARNHARHNMIHVEPSKMRKQANFIETVDDESLKKYQGVKATRKEMMEDEDESEDEEEEEDQSDLNDDDDEIEDEDLSGSEEDEDEEEEDEDDEEDESMDESIGELSESEEDRTASSKSKGKQLRFAEDDKENGKKSAAQNDAALLAELKQRSSEDAARGRDARKQIDVWGKLLGTRIRAQKVVRSTGRISTKAMKRYISDLEEKGKERFALEDSLDALDQLSSHLFKAQQTLLSSYASTSESGITQEALAELKDEIEKQTRESSRKRKAEEGDHLNDQIELLIKMHEDVYSPMWKDVLSKWSWRTSNATMEDKRKAKSKFDSSNAVGSSNGLKAIEQSAEEQIQRGMTGEAFERLRKRTRVWRGTENETRIDIDEQEGSEEDDETTNNTTNVENVDVFDDSDFYAALLRELIDNKGGLSTTDAEGSAASASWAQAAKRAAKKHRAVDRNASKGRRLRFDVHEKVQSFMPPIPTETWSIEQIDRLMQQLRNTYGNGKIDSTDENKEIDNYADDEVTKAPTEVALDGLRLFG